MKATPVPKRALRVLSAALLCTALSAAAQAPTIDLAPGDVIWRDTPTPGVKTAVLQGNLLDPGLYILRVKIAHDAKLMPHTHPDVRYTTVLSGEMHFGFGESFDADRMKVYPPGALRLGAQRRSGRLGHGQRAHGDHSPEEMKL